MLTSNLYRTMKRIKILAIVIVSVVSAYGQETYTYSNPDRDFYEGKELYVQQKYSIAERYFENFIENRNAETHPELLQEAHYYMASGAYSMQREDAEALLKQYLRSYPQSPFEDNCYLMLGNIAFRQHQYNKAMDYYDHVEVRHLTQEKKAELKFNKGYSYLQKKDYNQAKNQFANVMHGSSKYKASASYYHAYCNYAQGDYDAALSSFLSIEDEPEYEGFVPYYISQIYYKKKDYDRLLPYCEKILSRGANNPNDAEIYRILGECAYQQGDYAKTITAMNHYERLSKKVVRSDMYILGMSYFKTENYGDAVNRLSKVTSEKDSLSQNAYLHIGHSYVALGQKENARMAYLSASQMEFDKEAREEAAYNYALTTYETTAPFGESVKAFNEFLEQYPNSRYKDDVYERLVAVYMTTKNYAAASESLAKLSRLTPEMQDAKAYILFQLGTEDFVKEDYVSAIAHFNESEKAGSANFDVAQVLYWRGEAYYRQKDYVRSRNDFKQFLNAKGAKEFADYHKANYHLGYTYFVEKKWADAEMYFLRYIQSEPETKTDLYADALNRLGDCYFSTRDLVNAEKYYTKSAEYAGPNADYATFQRGYVQGLRKNYTSKIACLKRLVRDYPKSEYQDDARYEIGRAQVLSNQPMSAIESYKDLIAHYPNSPLSRKAALEIGMLYYNQGKDAEAIESYKQVVTNYPNSVETKTALESMEGIYVEQNNVSEYFDYTRSLGTTIVTTDASREDSLTYLAAERLYMRGDTTSSIAAFENYTARFCGTSNTINCLNAKYYLADCYYSRHRDDDARQQYADLVQKQGNPYMETSLVRLAQITYDKQDYEASLNAFGKLREIAQDPENVTIAKVGVLRSSYLVNDAASTIEIGEQLLADSKSDTELKREAHYYVAKAYMQTGQDVNALPHLESLAKEPKTAYGAESKYLVADYWFTNGNDKKAEKEITEFISNGTPYQYWLARAFVLLSDIYIKRGDDFQAKQYLLSLQANYTREDSIQDLIKERLENIAARESETIEN